MQIIYVQSKKIILTLCSYILNVIFDCHKDWIKENTVVLNDRISIKTQAISFAKA